MDIRQSSQLRHLFAWRTLAGLVAGAVCLTLASLSTAGGSPRLTGDAAVQFRAARLTSELRAEATLLRSAGPSRVRATRIAALSQERRAALAKLAADHPGQAARLLLSSRHRQALRAVPGAWVERSVTIRGHYQLVVNEGSPVLRQVIAANGRDAFTLTGSGTRQKLFPGDPIKATGALVAGRIFVGRGGVTRLSGTGYRTLAASGATTLGPTKVAVIVATFSDSTVPVDMNAIKANFQGHPGNDVVSYFAETSYGKMSVVPSFFGPYPLAASQSSCSNPSAQALISAAAADVAFAQFSRLVFVYNCPWSDFGSATGVGSVSTPQGAVQAAQISLDSGSAADLFSVVHEIAHTLGSFNNHAASYVCLPEIFIDPSRFDSGCASAEYGDPFDVLGSPLGGGVAQLDPYHKANAGWLDATQYPTVNASGTFTLAPYEQPSSTGQPLALNIPRGQSGTSFTVEYRQPIGVDAWTATSRCPSCTVNQGASIRLVTGASGGGGGSDTQLLDMTPGSLASNSYYPLEDVRDGALLPGKTFTDPEYGISIKAVSVGGSGLTVQVTVPAQTCVHGTPTVSTPSPAVISGAFGQSAISTVTLTNTDSAGCGANTFRFFPPTATSVNVVASPDFLTLAPGASATVSVGVSALPMAIAGGYDAGGGAFRSNSLGTGDAVVSGLSYLLTSAPDTTAPAAPTGLSASAAGSRAVSVSWSPATDNTGVVGYRVARAGAIFTTESEKLADNFVASGATYTYSVQAFDRNGNLSPAATATVTTPSDTDTTPPTPPDVKAVAGDHSLTVSWTASKDNVGVAYYRVLPCFVPQCVVPATTRSFTVAGLPTRTRYDVQILAVDGDGNSSWIGYGKYTVYTAAAGTSAPSQPQRLMSPSGSFRNVTLSWSASTDDRGVASYAVFRNNRQIASVTGTSYTDTLVGASSEYYVQAVDGDGSLSAPSARIWFPAPTEPSSDASAPTATVVSPAGGSTVSGSVTVTTASSDDVGVAKVQLFVDGVQFGEKAGTSPTWTWDTTGLANGTHWLYARALDAGGNFGSGAITTVSVANGASSDEEPPSVSLVTPSNGGTVTGPTTISATASDNVGVTKVDIVVDGSTVASDTSAPYNASWDATNVAPGPHTVSAVAHDAAGNTDQAAVSVTHPAPADTAAPTVSFTAPAGGSSVSGSTGVQLSVSDNVGVTKVELSVDGTLRTTLTGAPWSTSLDVSTLAVGSHTLSAKAFDAAGNSSVAQVSVTIVAAAPPAPPAADTSAPSTPGSLKALLAGTTQIVLTWGASKDNVGVAGYDVYRDGALVGSSTTTSFLDGGLVPASAHAYRVVARDAARNGSAQSSALNAKTGALARATTGTLSGVVLDGATGKAVANAVVQVTINGAVKSAKTNNSGVWKLASVPVGSFTATVTLSGYQSTSVSCASVGAQVTLALTLLSR